MASEFNESDVSDNDYEEAQSSSGDEYEEEDDYRIGGNSVVPCGKQSYEHLKEEQKSKIERAKSEHWIAKTFSQISGHYDSLHNKMNATTKESPKWCHICNKVGRGDRVRSCSKCEKLACEDHIVMLVLCTKCSRVGEDEHLHLPKPVAATGYCQVCQAMSRKRCSRCQKHYCRKHQHKTNEEKCDQCR